MKNDRDPLRILRYCMFISESFFERVRGLDFTMRDKTLLNKTDGRLHGYSKTNERHLRMIFNNIDWSYARSILDVGCGKGVVLREACRFPFTDVSGIEYVRDIALIARKNFAKMGGRYKSKYIWKSMINIL